VSTLKRFNLTHLLAMIQASSGKGSLIALIKKTHTLSVDDQRTTHYLIHEYQNGQLRIKRVIGGCMSVAGGLI
jgi:hypothetical protein